MSVAINSLIQEKQTLKTIKNCSLLPELKIKKIRSPFFYVGDKYKIIDQISKYFPEDIENFVEPFTGGGTVFLNTKAKKYSLNDIDEYLIKLHKFLNLNCENPELFFSLLDEKIKKSGLSMSYVEDIVPYELKVEYKKTYYAQFNKENYKKLRSEFNSNKNDLFALYILLIYGFNRMLRFNSSGDFNLPVGNVDLNKNVVNALLDYFDVVREKNIEFHNFDYEQFLNNMDLSENDFVYLDPPYLITFSEYNKFWNEDEERRLLNVLDCLHKKNIRWAISNMVSNEDKNAHNKIFAAWMKSYNVYEVNSNYISFNNNSIKPIKEVLVTNY